MWCVVSLDGVDEYFYDANDDYYHNGGDDVENFPTSQLFGTDWTAIEGISALTSFAFRET